MTTLLTAPGIPAEQRVQPWRPVRQRLPLGGAQTMAWQTWGAAEGVVWLVLHGGPGSGGQPALAQALDPQRCRIVLPDQRGAGLSTPRGSTRRNHLQTLVQDLERLRRHLGVERWSVLAGSWGTVLAQAYAQACPGRVDRLVLRGTFGVTRRELAGLLLPRGSARRWLGGDVLGTGLTAAGLPVCLRRAVQLLQSGTLGVTALAVLRRWRWMEQDGALRGLWRSAVRAQADADPQHLQRIRRVWRGLLRQQRRQRSTWGRPRAGPAERALWRKLRVQSHLLRSATRLRARLNVVVPNLVSVVERVDWVHGRFDAVCPERHSLQGFALGRARAPERVRLHRPLAGHLGSEPELLAALRRAVGGGA